MLLGVASYFLLPTALGLGSDVFAYTLPGAMVVAVPLFSLVTPVGRSIKRELCWLVSILSILLVIFTGPLILVTAGLFAIAGAVTPAR